MKAAGRVLATMIAMVAILLIAVGADKGLNYLERIKYEKECEELYAESHAQAEQLRTQLEELSQDEAAVETFLHEYAVDDLEDEDDCDDDHCDCDHEHCDCEHEHEHCGCEHDHCDCGHHH